MKIFITGEKSGKNTKFYKNLKKYCAENDVELEYIYQLIRDNGELYFEKIETKDDCILIQLPMSNPNQALVNIFTLPELIKSKVVAVPYFPYSREKSIYDVLLSKIGQTIITYDFHDCVHRKINNVKFSDIFANIKIPDDCFILAPDYGAKEKAKEMSAKTGLQFFLGNKTRLKNSCKCILPKIDPKYKKCIIVEDMISSGATIIGTISELKNIGITEISLIVTHILPESHTLYKESFEKIINSVKNIITTDVHIIPEHEKILQISTIESLFKSIKSHV